MAVKIYIEGGGKGTYGRCQEGFRSFLHRAGVASGTFEIAACGSRHDACKKFRIAVKKGDSALLLVDSEAGVDNSCQSGTPQSWLPWQHLGSLASNTLNKPAGCSNIDCHLMVQTTESWFMSDVDALREYFGKEFQPSALPKNPNPELVRKDDVLNGLEKASSKCGKKYSKGRHTFNMLMLIDPEKVVGAMPWAKRFVDHVVELQGT